MTALKWREDNWEDLCKYQFCCYWYVVIEWSWCVMILILLFIISFTEPHLYSLNKSFLFQVVRYWLSFLRNYLFIHSIAYFFLVNLILFKIHFIFFHIIKIYTIFTLQQDTNSIWVPIDYRPGVTGTFTGA